MGMGDREKSLLMAELVRLWACWSALHLVLIGYEARDFPPDRLLIAC